MTAIAKGADHYKYNEGEILEEIRAAIDATYEKHYSGEDGIQALDAIIASGNGEGFTVGNVQKYGFRYGKKGGYNRDDLIKVVHYAIVALYLNSRYAAQRQPVK